MKMIQSFNTAIQSLMVRLYTQMPTRSNRQRGASALEYIVLAAAIIIIVGFALNNDTVKGLLQDTFEGLFDSASDAAGPAPTP
ncbi:hypothetical protein ACEK07_17160 [Alcanivoracaceae bacterium MT1]